MALIIPPDSIVRAVAKFSHPATSQIQNVFDFLVNGAENVLDSDVVDAVDDYLSAVYGHIDALLDADTDLIDVTVSLLQFVTDHWETIAHMGSILALTGFTPAEVTDVLPASTACLLRARTNVPKHEGRKYFAPFTEVSNTSSGLFTSNVTNAVAAAGSEFLSRAEPIGVSGNTLEYVVLDVNQDIYRFPDNVVVTSIPAVQRRRKLFVGL